MKYVPTLVIAALSLVSPKAAEACFACSNWTTWGERLQLCPTPSEGLWLDALSCVCTGPCSDVCTDWCSGYDACEASGDPACFPPDAGNVCSACVEGREPFNGGLGCGATTAACSADRTDCVTCAAWLEGGNPSQLCPGPDEPDAISAAINTSDCACSSCAACATACMSGYLDVSAATFTCGACLGSTCSAELQICQAS